MPANLDGRKNAVRALDPAVKLWMPSVVTRIQITRFFVLNILVCYIICYGCGYSTRDVFYPFRARWFARAPADSTGMQERRRIAQDDMCSSTKSRRLRTQGDWSSATTMLLASQNTQYKTLARPPLDRRGKNETEIQIYSRKSELHRARGTLTHKNEKNHTDANIYGWA